MSLPRCSYARIFSVDQKGFQCVAAFPSCFCVLWLLFQFFKDLLKSCVCTSWWWQWCAKKKENWQSQPPGSRHRRATGGGDGSNDGGRIGLQARPLFLFSWMSIIRDIYLHNGSVSPPFFLCSYREIVWWWIWSFNTWKVKYNWFMYLNKHTKRISWYM